VHKIDKYLITTLDIKMAISTTHDERVLYVTSTRQSPYVECDEREVYKTIYETRMICDEDTVGSFTIESNFDNSLLTMSISVDESFQGQGHARGMIETLCVCLSQYGIIRRSQLLYIDTDASDEFWGHIGMNKNANFENEDRTIIGSGYEYEIVFGKLEDWANKK
jgi:GNAT superfamily N-acetyltransferase